ncbi:hypothetical protein R3P38DRAFT_3222153 [Favolaschia claudopus]|uniref:Uncharacterized protein n=1 Tax=Favolaschia claudopus TaxID=2862362 RepID=A0AAV9ZZL3_9AGAR
MIVRNSRVATHSLPSRRSTPPPSHKQTAADSPSVSTFILSLKFFKLSLASTATPLKPPQARRFVDTSPPRTLSTPPPPLTLTDASAATSSTMTRAPPSLLLPTTPDPLLCTFTPPPPPPSPAYQTPTLTRIYIQREPISSPPILIASATRLDPDFPAPLADIFTPRAVITQPSTRSTPKLHLQGHSQTQVAAPTLPTPSTPNPDAANVVSVVPTSSSTNVSLTTSFSASALSPPSHHTRPSPLHPFDEAHPSARRRCPRSRTRRTLARAHTDIQKEAFKGKSSSPPHLSPTPAAAIAIRLDVDFHRSADIVAAPHIRRPAVSTRSQLQPPRHSRPAIAAAALSTPSRLTTSTSSFRRYTRRATRNCIGNLDSNQPGPPLRVQKRIRGCATLNGRAFATGGV